MRTLRLQSLMPMVSILVCLNGFALAARAADFRVGLALDKGGRDDQSFNAAAYRGSQEAEKGLGVKVKVLEGRDDNSETLLRSLAEKKFDLIIAIGVNQTEAIKKVSAQFPERKFVLVDAEVTAPNVKSVIFEEHQGAFLVGAIAGLVSKTGKVGFIGGMEIPLIRRFQMGYEAGVHHVKKSTKVVSNFAGVTGDAWNNPAKGKELALAQYGAGADIIFAAAGATNLGVFDAAEEKKTYAIGVDSNQNGVKPGRILTSMLKRVDLAVYKVIEAAKSGKFGAGTERRGLDAEGVDFAVDAHNQAILPQDVITKVNALKADIISGKIAVPDYYKQGKAR
jgi:basic membrane protein A and related proteins